MGISYGTLAAMRKLMLAGAALAVVCTHRGRWWLADLLTVSACAIAPPIPREYELTDEQAERIWARVSAGVAREAASAAVRHD